MPVQWNLKQWLALKRHIYRPSELQTLLEEKAGMQLSLQAISSLLNNVPNALRLTTIQALCNALDCTLSDFCQIVPDQPGGEPVSQSLPNTEVLRQGRLADGVDDGVNGQSVDRAIREIVLSVLKEQGLLGQPQEAVPAQRPTISVVLPSWIWSIGSDLTRGIVEELTQNTYNTVLYSDCDENEGSGTSAGVERFVMNPRCVGLITVFPGRLTASLTRLSRQGFPVVVIDDQDMQVVPWVEVDNISGAYKAVRHLLGLGHRRIAHIQGPGAFLVSHARYQGYRRALLEAGIPPDEDLVLEGDFLPPSGRACARKLFALPVEKRPTAIFAASDQMAYGVLTAAEEAGISVPGELALVGFDDDQPSLYTRPPLTTIRQPYFEMGQRSAALLLSLLGASDPEDMGAKGKPPRTLPSPLHIQLQTNLVVRESCGANYHTVIASSATPPFST